MWLLSLTRHTCTGMEGGGGVGGGQFELLCKLVCVCVRACASVRACACMEYTPSPSPVKNGGECVKVYLHHGVM